MSQVRAARLLASLRRVGMPLVEAGLVLDEDARGAAGAAADVVLFDPDTRWKVERRALASQGKHTPFLGYELAGQVRATVVRGRVAFQR